MLLRHLLKSRFDQARELRAAGPDVPSNELLGDLDWIRQQKGAGQPNKKVVILGAGIAGLSCAYELGRIGYKVVVLEAEPEHVGGRVRTHRCEASDGRELHAELGAMRIPVSHRLTRRYVDEFGLGTRPFVMSNPESMVHVRKHAFRLKDLQANEALAMNRFSLTAEERELGYEGMWKRAVLDVLGGLSEEQIRELYAKTLTDEGVIELDHKGLSAALQDADLSRDAREYVMTMIGLETALPIALTEHLREEHEEVWIGDFLELVGGTGRLAGAFHDALGDKVRQGCAVHRIEQSAGNDEAGPKATAYYRDPQGVERSETGDWIICTIPLGVLNRIDIQGAFDDAHLRAIQGVNYDPSSKVIGRVPYRWWEKEQGIYGGGSMFDTQMGSTWYPSDNAPRGGAAPDPTVTDSESLFLASYTWGQLARRIAAVPDQELDCTMVRELGRVHPAVAKDPGLYASEIRWCWDQVPTQAGAYAFFLPGEQFRFYQDLVEPDGCICLAGEHVSHTHSWIQGAIESAIVAMRHIVTATGKVQ